MPEDRGCIMETTGYVCSSDQGGELRLPEFWIRDSPDLMWFVDLKPGTGYEMEVCSKSSSGESTPVLVKIRTNPEGDMVVRQTARIIHFMV